MEQVLNIIKNETLTYNQQVLQLAGQAESTLNVLNIDEETKIFLIKKSSVQCLKVMHLIDQDTLYQTMKY